MVLLHEAVQIVNEPLPSVFSVLKVDTYVNGLHGTDLLAHPAEDAPELVDLVDDGVPIPLVVLPTHQADAVGRTNRGAEPAGHTLGATIGVNFHSVCSPPPG